MCESVWTFLIHAVVVWRLRIFLCVKWRTVESLSVDYFNDLTTKILRISKFCKLFQKSGAVRFIVKVKILQKLLQRGAATEGVSENLKYSRHLLIQMSPNSNFHYFEQISKSLEFGFVQSYILCCLTRTPIIWTFR